jgi:SAM-dependent methyltransferase
MRQTSPYSKGFFSLFEEKSQRSAEVIVPIVLDLVKPASVVDVGCGIGTWTRVLRQHVSDVTGVDGDWVPAASRGSTFVACDLERPLDLGRRFDLAISMEVAEHLSPGSAERFVGDLVSLAPAVLFSAAIPKQGGANHQNERWQSFWADLFHRHGFYPHDVVRPKVWTNAEVEPWYAQNSLLYRREEGALAVLDLVHPQHYLNALAARTPRSRLDRIVSRAPRRAVHLLRRGFR